MWPNETWVVDFVHDQLACRKIWVLAVSIRSAASRRSSIRVSYRTDDWRFVVWMFCPPDLDGAGDRKPNGDTIGSIVARRKDCLLLEFTDAMPLHQPTRGLSKIAYSQYLGGLNEDHDRQID